MKQPITAETLFEESIEQKEVLEDAVATQVPYTPEKNVSIAFTLVEKSSLYYDGTKQWRRKPAIEKTWDNFKDCFAQEFHEVSVITSTAHEVGYSHICAATGQSNSVVQGQI